MASENFAQMHPDAPAPDFVNDLVALLLRGKLLRPDLVAAARRRLADGDHPEAEEVAEAVVREALQESV